MATYYVNGSTGNDSHTPTQALNPSTPWRTLYHAYQNIVPLNDTLSVSVMLFTGPFLLDNTGQSATQGVIDNTGVLHTAGALDIAGDYSAGPVIINSSGNFQGGGIIDLNGVVYSRGILDVNGAEHNSGYLSAAGDYALGGAGYPGITQLFLTQVVNNQLIPLFLAPTDSSGIEYTGAYALNNTAYTVTLTYTSNVWQLTDTGTVFTGSSSVLLGAYSDGTFVYLAAPTPVGNSLAQRGDLENIFGVSNVIKWAVLSNNNPTSTAGLAEISYRINWALGLSSTDFRNAMRQGGYVVPCNGPDGMVWQTNIVAIRAGLYLYMHLRPTQRGEDGRPLPDKYDGLFTFAEQQLNFARSRKLKLDGTLYGRGTNAPFVTHQPNHDFAGPGQLGYGPNVLPGNYPYGG